MSVFDLKTTFQDGFSEEIWGTTYKDYKDTDVNFMLKRTAVAIASVEATEQLRQEWSEKYYEMLTDFKVVVGGRIMANAGTEWHGTTLMNCFVGPRAKYDVDSLKSILFHLESQAQTLKSEGGWGENFSYLRPRGAFINGIGVESPGAIKYMELFDKSSEIITSGSGKKSDVKKAKGKIRKGAQMGVLDCFEKSVKMLTNKGWQTFEQICEERDSELKAITEDGEYPIVDWIINPPNELFEVEDDAGNTVTVTADHKFVVHNVNTGKEYLKSLKDIDPETELLVRLE